MRRILVLAALVIACVWTVAVFGVIANSGAPVTHQLYAASGTGTIQYVFATTDFDVPTSFTLYSKDGSIFWFKRRFADGVNDTVGIPVPAGASMLVPSPSAIFEADSMRMTIWVEGATDTVFALPWKR